jgi:hypothetical protein
MAAGECQCPKIQPAQWQDREVSLVGQSFLAARTPLFMHVPRRLHVDLESLASQIDGVRYRLTSAPMVLHRDGWFSGEVLVSVDHAAAGAPPVQTFHNLFYSRVVPKPGFDPALREMPRFYRDLRAAKMGRIDAMYFWYLNCPKCLLEQGAAQIILLARSTKVLAANPCPAPSGPANRGQFLPCGV